MLEALTFRQVVAGLALLLGAALALAGLAAVALSEWRGRREGSRPEPPAGSGTGRPVGTTAEEEPERRWRPDEWLGPTSVWILLGLVVLVGAWLRIHEIGLGTITHTEAMLPNLPWPPDSWPPARHSFYDTFWWHFHSELHPQAHYLLIWGWTKLFGTSLASLRLPSALFGIGSILVAFRIGALTHGRTVGLLSAAFVAFNGLHVFNGQYARVYMMGTFLGLLSTLCLLQVMRGGERRWRWELVYLASSWLAIHTQTFFWFLLAVQMIWVAIQPRRPEAFVRRILGLQAIVVMAGAPEVAHFLYVRAPAGYPGPTPGFLVDYLLFGFALRTDITSIPPRVVAAPVYIASASIAIVLVAVGSLAWIRAWRTEEPAGPGPGGVEPGRGEDPVTAAPDRGRAGGIDAPRRGWGDELPQGGLWTIALGCTLVTLGLVIVALRWDGSMAIALALPFLAAIGPSLYGALRRFLVETAAARQTRRWAEAMSQPIPLLVMLAFLPTLFLFIMALHRSYLHPRALMMFSSYLLILAPIGVWTLGRSRAIRVPLLVALIAIHTVSVRHWRAHPSEGRNYRELAELMGERMRPGDYLFVVPEAYFVTPLFYYVDGDGYRYVTDDYAEAVAGDGLARVWLVYFSSYEWGAFQTTTPEMTDALTGFRLVDEVETLRARAELFVREAGS